MGKKGITEKKVTECTLARESYGITKTDMARMLGISLPVYSLSETGSRPVSKTRMEQMYYEINHAGSKVVREKKARSEDLELNTYDAKGKEFNTIEEEIEDELGMELHYEHLTQEKFEHILMKYIFNGKTLVNASAMEGVCPDELKKRLDREKIDYQLGENWETLTKAR